ncbi:2 -3 -cyclic-nucleotide 3 -phosphodiesterase-like isoform X2 [Brachionus plicatilis]|uniref:2',3'-cyclic-nucleotide 3'-phosphodiesterase n=1 Tax=Brachionus plicatilis TaxID=10195 RepID=A0A3M7Q8F3_BRAPC|nr:2 -3 -cyclic-nucleotide 3 -phosphodiesterase-like isoform X2 [Brachionus plicatilis]
MRIQDLQILSELDLKLSDHCFLIDPDTINFLKKSKVLFINRGLPGSGKSTLAARICQTYQDTEICEGDQFFTNEFGAYKFNKDRVQDCRLYIQQKVQEVCRLGKKCVIADDTHLSYEEIEPLIRIGKEFNYFILLIEARSSHKFDVDKLHELCRHNISKATIQKKLDAFELIIPRFYAWFLNHADSEFISSLAKTCFQECLDILEFKKDFNDTKNSFVFEELFEIRNQNQLHCTAKFLGKDSDLVKEYFFDLEVNQSMGKVFTIEIVGFSITNRSITADVRLRNVGNLWQNDLNEEEMEEVMENEILLNHKSLFDELKYADRAHLTLALEPNLSACKSGIDLVTLKLLLINKNYKNLKTNDYDLFYFGQCLCYAKLRKIIKIPSLFAAQY